MPTTDLELPLSPHGTNLKEDTLSNHVGKEEGLDDSAKFPKLYAPTY